MRMEQRAPQWGFQILLCCNLLLLGVVALQYVERHGGAVSAGGASVPASSSAAESLLAPAAPAADKPVSRAALPDLTLAADRISRSIISIGAVRTVVGRAQLNDFFSPFYIPMQYEQRVPYLGSGVIVSSDGTAITNYHVVENAKDFFATLPTGEEVKATLIDADTVLDVAVLRLEANSCVPAELGDSDALRLGQWTLAVGNPFGNAIRDPHPTVTQGVISALKRSFNPEEGRHRVYQDMIQTDAAINPGNSGGALVDDEGRVIGINTFIFTSGGGSQGIGFAIPINRAKRVIQEIEKFGRVRQLRADFEVIDITGRLQRYLRLSDSRGVYVRSIERGGPAERAGLTAGDVILALDDKPVDGADMFWTLFAVHYVGDEVTLTVSRKGATQKIRYKLSESPRQ